MSNYIKWHEKAYLPEVYARLTKAGMIPVRGLIPANTVFDDTAFTIGYEWTLYGRPIEPDLASDLIEMHILRWLCALQYKDENGKDQHALVDTVCLGDEMLGGYHETKYSYDNSVSDVGFVHTGGPSGLYAQINLYTDLNYGDGARWFSHNMYHDAIWDEYGIIPAAMALLEYIDANRLTIYTGITDAPGVVR